MSSPSPQPEPSGRAVAAADGAPPRAGVIACGALSAHITEIADRRGWPVDVHAVSPLLHNRPDRIAGEVAALLPRLRPRYGHRLAVAYAECGTSGALDAVCEREALVRLAGRHCYDALAGASRVDDMLDAEPGTYLLTDFLVRAFERAVVVELGLDRWPELRDDYFGNYRRVVWLATSPSPELTARARRAADVLGLPLEIVDVGDERLEHELADLLTAVA